VREERVESCVGVDGYSVGREERGGEMQVGLDVV
jgi:hypothetical protein